MQNYGFMKLGMVALLSVALVACKTADKPAEKPAAAPTPPAPAAARPAPPASGLSAAEIAKRDAALKKTVFYFEFDKSDLSQEDRDALVYHAAALKANGKHIRLEGHADERGTRAYNLALGERRAKAVSSYLQVQGVAASQMETISYGEERPADPGKTEAAYSKNRRVEMK